MHGVWFLYHALPVPPYPGLTPSTASPLAATGAGTRLIGRHLIDVKSEEDVLQVVDKIIYWIYPAGFFRFDYCPSS